MLLLTALKDVLAPTTGVVFTERRTVENVTPCAL